MQAVPESDVLSWRDPDGFVVNVQGRILRAVHLEKAAQTQELLRAPWMVQLMADGVIPKTVEVVPPPGLVAARGAWFWLEHEVVQFPCYPQEITALQLYDSGLLTLQIALEAARQGWTLKDASASNVLHSTGRPVFVDILSFERGGSAATWIAYGQFVRNFLLPLLLYQKLGITPTDVFLGNRDGITPERAYEMLHGTHMLSATVLEHVLLPKWLTRAGGRLIQAQSTHTPKPVNAEIQQELLLGTLRRLGRTLEKLSPLKKKSASVWKEYEEDRSHYTERDLAAKTGFVREHLGEGRTVLDLGCNAGEFSLLAAELGKSVVAADGDHPALSRLYARIRGKEAPISPLMLNIGRPTPALGWANAEIASFLDRAVGQFDCVLVLGLIHHLLVSERASLAMLAELLDRLRPKSVILEWVDPRDPKFKQLAGLNGSLYSHLNEVRLEESLKTKFRMVAKLTLPCATRVMYLWHRHYN
jgi:SAM-dependent methyltransferase